MDKLIWGLLLSMMPFGELRAGIPVAISGGNPIIHVALLCIAANIAIVPLLFLFMNFFHHRFMNIKIYKRLFRKIINKIRKKVSENPNIEKWEYIGLALFVAIPIPGSGAYTGTLMAWLLGFKQIKSMIAIAIGVILAGLLVTAISSGVLGVANLFAH